MQRLLNDSLVVIATVTEDSRVACRFFVNHTARDIWYGSCNSLWWFVQSRDVFQEKGVVPLTYSSNRKTNKHLKSISSLMVFRNYRMLFLKKLGTFFSTIRFFMENHKQQTWECQETAVLCCVSAVCCSRLNGRRGVQREVIYGKVFCHWKLYSLYV